VYPPLRDIRKISRAIATRVAEKAYALKLTRGMRPRSVASSVRRLMYDP
jgi:hypothetical protein